MLALKLFLSKYWKYIACILAILGLVWYANHWYNNKLVEAFNNGVTNERTIWQARVDEENQNNREFEAQMESVIESFSQSLVDSRADRIERETTHTETIERMVAADPIYQECVVDPAIIEERNAIREEGPPAQ